VWKLATTSAALVVDRGVGGDQEPGVVVEDVEDVDLDASGEFPVGESACQRSLGMAASKRT
jgi:hypothetical protein